MANPECQRFSIKPCINMPLKKRRRRFFITGSSYVGQWSKIDMWGTGKYKMPHKVVFIGGTRNGTFHGDGSLIYPSGHKIEGMWDQGKLVSGTIIFQDGLECDFPFYYCISHDRRYYISYREGFKPAGCERLTNAKEARKIPEGCYDTGDGFYDPNINGVLDASDLSHIIRIPTTAEERWIKAYCRKSWDEPVGYRPDMYKRWTTGRRCERVPSSSLTTCNSETESVLSVSVCQLVTIKPK